MPDSREMRRWEASRTLTVAAVVAGGILALAPVVLAAMTGRSSVLGLPTSDFLSGIVVPSLIAATIFWFARNQDRIDRRFDAPES